MDDTGIFKLVSAIENKLTEKEMRIKFIDESIIEIEIGENKLRIKKESDEAYDGGTFRSLYRVSIINKDQVLIESKEFEGEINMYLDQKELNNIKSIKENEYDKVFRSLFIKARKVCYKTDSIIQDMLKELE